MDVPDVIRLSAILILIILSALFSSIETAFVSCSRLHMRVLEEGGNVKAGRVLKILDNQGKMLSAILIGNNVVNLSASALVSIFAQQHFGNTGVSIATGVLTFIVLVFGEVSPKTYATLHADRMALKYSGFVNGLMVFLTPLIFIVNKTARGFLRVIGTDPDVKDSGMTEEELSAILDVSHEDGLIEKEEREMIRNVVDFGDSRAKDIMIPRVDMTFVQADMSYEELLDVFRENRFTRMPVYDEEKDEVLGILNMKDVVLYDHETTFSVRDFIRDAFFTIESKHTSELLAEMRANSVTMAIVLDEYGATSGMITLEDLLEEIVGEIRDEYDEDEKEQIKEVAPDEYLIEASVKLDDINDALGTDLSSEDYDSLGGFVIGALDHLPEAGEQVQHENIVLTVESVEKNRIDRIRLRFLNEEEMEDTEEEKAGESD